MYLGLGRRLGVGLKIAIVTLATQDYFPGVKTLFESIQSRHSEQDLKYFLFSNEPSAYEVFKELVDKVVGIPPEFDGMNFNEKVPRFKITLFKLFSVRFLEETDFDRVIFLDSDLMCVGDISNLLEPDLSKFQILAVRDYACSLYYPAEIAIARLDPNLIFNTGCLILNRSLLDSLTYTELVYTASNLATSYDGGDQGYINFITQNKRLRLKLLPVKFNYPLDANYPVVFRKPALIHFSGDKPWLLFPEYPRWDKGLYCFYKFQSDSERLSFFRYFLGDAFVSILWVVRNILLAIYKFRTRLRST